MRAIKSLMAAEREDFLKRSVIQSIFMCLLLEVPFSPITDGLMDKSQRRRQTSECFVG